MRPSSSPWRDLADQPPPAAPPPGLFDQILARGPVRAAVSDAQWLRHLLAVESALAAAAAAHGLIPPAAAAAIQAACERVALDPAGLARAAAAGPGNPVLPLVRELREAAGPEAAGYVHFGATSQDILDTAAMLVIRDALLLVRAAVRDAAGAAAALARRHRDTPMAGRTLLRHALPVTFGLVAAGWLTGLDAAGDQLAGALDATAVQLGGAVGTRHAYAGAGAGVAAHLAASLHLATPVLPWHTDRTRIGLIAGALGTTAGAVGKVARDVSLLAGSDAGEVAEAAPGGSSAMPHKRNPVASVAALACAAQAPGLVGTLLGSMVQEHQRAAGAWHAEWRPLRELLVAVGSAAEWLRVCLSGLTVDTAAMAANLDRLRAAAGLDDPAGHLRAAGDLVDAALTAHENRE